MSDVIVTGASGFIGVALCELLNELGFSIIALNRADGDISKHSVWSSLPPVKTVFHLAGRSFIPDSWLQTSDFLDVNVSSTHYALEYCRRTGAKLIFASAYIYGIPQVLPISEQHPIFPNNPYALTKFLSEQLCEFYSTYHSVTVISLRLFNVYGPRQSSNFLIAKIIHELNEFRAVRLLDLAPKRDYVYVDDVANAFVRAMHIDSGYHIFNIGSGFSYSVSEIVDKIQLIMRTNHPIKVDSVERRNEIPDVIADISLAKEVLGWYPNVELPQGLVQTIDHFTKS